MLRCSASLRLRYPLTFRCSARSTASAPAGTSFVITEPAPVFASFPIVTGATNIVSEPMLAPSPITVRCFSYPSKLTVTVPAPTFTSVPISVSPT